MLRPPFATLPHAGEFVIVDAEGEEIRCAREEVARWVVQALEAYALPDTERPPPPIRPPTTASELLGMRARFHCAWSLKRTHSRSYTFGFTVHDGARVFHSTELGARLDPRVVARFIPTKLARSLTEQMESLRIELGIAEAEWSTQPVDIERVAAIANEE